jgi:tetrahydromethanopterin:alpha-L-glutamate ligase
MRRVVIFSENTGWHEQALLAVLSVHQVDAAVCSLRDCRIGFEADGNGIVIPGFEGHLPDAAFVRAVPAGGFEEVALRLDILHALGACGIPVYNPATAIEYTVDKGMTSFLLLRSGIPTPRTWVCESREAAVEVIRSEAAANRRLVLKPLFGNCGRGLLLLDDPGQLPPREEVNGVYYLQGYLRQSRGSGRDWRVFVINGQAVAAMERVSGHWISNRARGGKCLSAVLTDPLRAIAEPAAVATGACYAGVDVIMDETGNYAVLEVNGIPAWRGLQSVCPRNIAELLVNDFLLRLSTGGESSITAV